MEFLTKLARRYNAKFKSQHGHLLFYKEDGNKVSGEKIPESTINFVKSWKFRSTNKDAYSGVRAWHWDTELGKKIETVVGKAGNLFDLEFNSSSEEQASLDANAKYEELNGGSDTLDLVIPATDKFNPAVIRAGQFSNVSGIRTGIDGKWFNKKLEATLNSSGFLLNLSCEKK